MYHTRLLEPDLLELMLSNRSKKNTKCVNGVSEELTAAKHKLMLLVVAASTPIPAAKPKFFNIAAAPAVSTRRRKGVEAQKAEDLRKRLEIVQDEDKDVFIEATPLAQKLFLLVERRYPLSRFTLEQLVNVARLKVEEKSKMSLELLRRSKRNTKCVNAANEELTAAKHKLMLLI
nr:hypothetical protein [Tanacetum cinerariifolium]